MRPPLPRVFADIGATLIDSKELDGRVLIKWAGLEVTAMHFKLAYANYHGVSLDAMEKPSPAATGSPEEGAIP